MPTDTRTSLEDRPLASGGVPSTSAPAGAVPHPDPGSRDAKLDTALDDSFPTSDPPSTTPPGHHEPAPSSGFAEKSDDLPLDGE